MAVVVVSTALMYVLPVPPMICAFVVPVSVKLPLFVKVPAPLIAPTVLFPVRLTVPALISPPKEFPPLNVREPDVTETALPIVTFKRLAAPPATVKTEPSAAVLPLKTMFCNLSAASLATEKPV